MARDDAAEAMRLLAMASVAVSMGKLAPSVVVGALAGILDISSKSQLPLLPAEASVERRSKRDDTAAVMRIFEHWKRSLDHPHARLTPERVRVIRARMREGYTERQIMGAINGCAASPFHTGENDQGTRYDDLTLICRSGSNVERFAAKAPDGEVAPQSKEQEKQDDAVAAIRREMAEARKAGDRERYEQANRRLAAALART